MPARSKRPLVGAVPPRVTIEATYMSSPTSRSRVQSVPVLVEVHQVAEWLDPSGRGSPGSSGVRVLVPSTRLAACKRKTWPMSRVNTVLTTRLPVKRPTP